MNPVAKLLRVGTLTMMALPLLAIGAPAAAQDVRYETVTTVDLPGALGTVARAVARLGGGSMSTVDTTYIKGNKMRTDVDGSSTILDLDERRFLSLDHRARTYVSMTFDEMIAEAKGAMETAAAADRNEPEPSGDPRAEWTFRFDVQRSNERERIASYEADRYFLTLEAEQAYAPEDGDREKAGTLVVFTDVATSTEVPVFGASAPVDDALARELTQTRAATAEMFAAAFADDPGVKAGFERAAEALAEIEGTPLRTVMHFVAVAPDERFDRQLALGVPPEGPSLAQQAGRAALGGLTRGLRGGGGQQQAQPEPEPTQVTLVKVTSEVRNVSTATLDVALFQVPEGYRPVQP
jgi:hypothetical protein